LAASLVSLVDEERGAQRLQRRLETLEFKRKAENSDLSGEKETNYSPSDYAEISWMLIGTLNANRIPTRHFDELAQFVQAASQLPLNESYPIYALVLENLIRRWSNSTEQS